MLLGKAAKFQPQRLALGTITKETSETQIKEAAVPSYFKISNKCENKNSELLTKFNITCKEFPEKLTLYHLTRTKNAEHIIQNGFDIKLCKQGAFGTGIYLSRTIEHLKRYYDKNKDEKGEVALIKCEVCVSKFHENFSHMEDTEFLKKNNYSRPEYDHPKEGFDSMHACNETIWIIPSSSNVCPKILYIGEFVT